MLLKITFVELFRELVLHRAFWELWRLRAKDLRFFVNTVRGLFNKCDLIVNNDIGILKNLEPNLQHIDDSAVEIIYLLWKLLINKRASLFLGVSTCPRFSLLHFGLREKSPLSWFNNLIFHLEWLLHRTMSLCQM